MVVHIFLQNKENKTKTNYHNLIKPSYIIINILKIQGQKKHVNNTQSKIQILGKYTRKTVRFLPQIEYKKNKGNINRLKNKT